MPTGVSIIVVVSLVVVPLVVVLSTVVDPACFSVVRIGCAFREFTGAPLKLVGCVVSVTGASFGTVG